MYNKAINITEDDILKTNDFNTLRQIRMDIEQHLAETNLNFSKYDRLMPKQKQYLSSLIGLRKLCRTKIKNHMDELRENGLWKSPKEIKQQMHLSSIFMEEAKKNLPKELYKEILDISREILNNRLNKK